MISDEQEARILNMLDDGVPVKKIARDVDVSTFTVHRVKHSPRRLTATMFRRSIRDGCGTVREQIVDDVPFCTKTTKALASVALDVIELNELAIIDHPLLKLLATRAEKALKGERNGG